MEVFMKKFFLSLIFLLFAGFLFSSNPTTIVSAEKSPWIETNLSIEPLENIEDYDNALDIIVLSSNKGRTVEGFGGAFNEKGWTALQTLPEAKRREALAALFDKKSGCRFNFCRVPIGASDYADSRYTLAEEKNDFAMKSFSIDRDRKSLIPYIKAAMEFCPDLKLYGSAWTPPPWMKTRRALPAAGKRNSSSFCMCRR